MLFRSSREKAQATGPIIQVTVDHSPSDMEPVEELALLNQSRTQVQKHHVGYVEQQTATFNGYGVSAENPIVVNGILGLAIYLKTLRFKGTKAAVIGILESALLSGNYPVDRFLVTNGTDNQRLYFCIYGRNSDKIYPVGFYREAFYGDFDYQSRS